MSKAFISFCKILLFTIAVSYFTQNVLAVTVTVGTSKSVVQGGSATINWSVSDNSNCTASMSGGGPNNPGYPYTADGLSSYWMGDKSQHSFTISPVLAPPETYTFTCRHYTGGVEDARGESTLTVLPPPTATISANPTNVSYGGVSTLSLTSKNSTICKLAYYDFNTPSVWHINDVTPNPTASDVTITQQTGDPILTGPLTGSPTNSQTYYFKCGNNGVYTPGYQTTTINVCPASAPTWNPTTSSCVPPMTGWITTTPATTCTIPANQSSCTNTTLDWGTSNPIGTSAVTNDRDNTFLMTGNSDFARAISPSGAYISNGGVTYSLTNNSQLLAQVNVKPKCTDGSYWDSTLSICIPSLSVTASVTSQNPLTYPPNKTFELTATITNKGTGTKCRIVDNTGTPFSPSNGPSDIYSSCTTGTKLTYDAPGVGNWGYMIQAKSDSQPEVLSNLVQVDVVAPTPYSCTPTSGLPANTTIWDPSGLTGLTSDTPYTYYYSYTSAKCAYKCTAGFVRDTIASACINPLSLSANISSQNPITLPTTAFTISYSLNGTGTGADTDCYLLDNASNIISTDNTCSGTFNWNTPAAANPSPNGYGYYVRAIKNSTGETVTTSLLREFVNPYPPVKPTVSQIDVNGQPLPTTVSGKPFYIKWGYDPTGSTPTSCIVYKRNTANGVTNPAIPGWGNTSSNFYYTSPNTLTSGTSLPIATNVGGVTNGLPVIIEYNNRCTGPDGLIYDSSPTIAHTITFPTGSFRGIPPVGTPYCTIPTGQPSCTSQISWTSSTGGTVNLTDCSGGVYTSPSRPEGDQTYSNPPGITIPYGGGCYNIRDVLTSMTLATANLTASCASTDVWDGSKCVTNACSNGADNPLTCNHCPAPNVYDTTSSSCVAPLGISITPPGTQTISLPASTAFTVPFTITNGGSGTTCLLLNYNKDPLGDISTSCTGISGSKNWIAPNTYTGGTYNYYVQATKGSQTVITAVPFTVTVNPLPKPTAWISQTSETTNNGDTFYVSYGSTYANTCTVSTRTLISGGGTNPFNGGAWATAGTAAFPTNSTSGGPITRTIALTGTPAGADPMYRQWKIQCTNDSGSSPDTTDSMVSVPPSYISHIIQCPVGNIWDGSSCVPPTYSCSGTAPTGLNFTSKPANGPGQSWTYIPTGTTLSACTWSCDSGYGPSPSGNSCTQLLPDLTVLLTQNPTVTPSYSTVGQNVTFTGNVYNNGPGVASNFPNMFNIINSATGASVVNIAATSIPSLGANTSSGAISGTTASLPAGTYKVRTCANTNTDWTNSITEVANGLGNNCGDYTSFTVGNTWSAQVDQPANCTILAGETYCRSITISWRSSGLSNTNFGACAYSSPYTPPCDNTTFLPFLSGVPTGSIIYNNKVSYNGIYARLSGYSDDGVLRDGASSIMVKGVCDQSGTGSTWDPSKNICVANTVPSTTFTGSYGSQTNQTTLNLPYGGGTVGLNWSVANAAGGSCAGLSDTGVNSNWPTYYLNGKGSNGSDSVTVPSTTRFTLSCWDSHGVYAVPNPVSVQVNVCPASTPDWNGNSCVLNVTVSVSANTPYNVNPNENVSFIYNPSTNSGGTQCELLDNAQSALTSYQPSSPIIYPAPSGVSSYGYYIKCQNTTTPSATAISNQIIVNTNATLTVNTSGTGSGSVTGAGIYSYNTTASPSATPVANSLFSGWSGNCSGATSPTSVLMNANKTCTANFTLNTFTLTINKTGTGGGVVTGAGTYNSGQVVTMTATPNLGSLFLGWSGDADCTDGSVTMNVNKTCSANFSVPTASVSQLAPSSTIGDSYQIVWSSTYTNSCTVKRRINGGAWSTWANQIPVGSKSGSASETSNTPGTEDFQNSCIGLDGTTPIDSAIMTHFVNCTAGYINSGNVCVNPAPTVTINPGGSLFIPANQPFTFSSQAIDASSDITVHNMEWIKPDGTYNWQGDPQGSVTYTGVPSYPTGSSLNLRGIFTPARTGVYKIRFAAQDNTLSTYDINIPSPRWSYSSWTTVNVVTDALALIYPDNNDKTKLRWKCSNSDTATLITTNGPKTNDFSGISISQNAEGQIIPSAGATYTLTCDNSVNQQTATFSYSIPSITGSNITSNSAKVTWNCNNVNALSASLERIPWVNSGSLPVISSRTDVGLTSDTEYIYTLKCFDRANLSGNQIGIATLSLTTLPENPTSKFTVGAYIRATSSESNIYMSTQPLTAITPDGQFYDWSYKVTPVGGGSGPVSCAMDQRNDGGKWFPSPAYPTDTSTYTLAWSSMTIYDKQTFAASFSSQHDWRLTCTDSIGKRGTLIWSLIKSKSYPKVINAALDLKCGTGLNPVLNIQCLNSDSYEVRKGDNSILSSGVISSGVNVPVTITSPDTYKIICKKGGTTPLSSSEVLRTYSSSMCVSEGITFNASPRLIEAGGVTTLNWDISHPTASCTLTVTPICAGTCSSSRIAEVDAINTAIANGTTLTDQNDPNNPDPNNPRKLIDSLRQQAFNNGVSGKAVGKKTFRLNYTTDFKIDCGSAASSTLRVLITNANEG